MEELRKVTKNKDVSLATKAKITHSLIFPITVYSVKVEQWGRIEKNRFIWSTGLEESSTDTLQKDQQVGPRANSF